MHSLCVSPEVHRDKCEDRAVSDGKGTITDKTVSQYDTAARVLVRKIPVPVKFVYPNFETAPRVKMSFALDCLVEKIIFKGLP